MKERSLFHSVANKDNPDYVESNAPFRCTVDAWLGDGYYFWESFKEYAHWWGKRHYSNNYFICETSCDYDTFSILDLDDIDTIIEIRKIVEDLQEMYSCTITVPAIIDYIIKRINKYDLIRACSNNIIGIQDSTEIKALRISFSTKNNRAYLDLCPPIQVCFPEKHKIPLPLKIIYPETYKQGFCI